MVTDLLQKIHDLKTEIDSKRPLTSTELRELRKWYDVSYTYNSNAIEGNTLTLAETKVIIEDGLTVGGKQIREILEAKNHKTVLDELFNVVDSGTELDEPMLHMLHEKLLFDIDLENAGSYRKIQVFISGSDEELPAADQIQPLMDDFFSWFKNEKDLIDPVERAIKTHYTFVKIHPYIDGNGRIARLLTNLVLMQAGYPPIIVPVVRRLEYIQSIQSEEMFMQFMLETVYENLKDYLRMVG